MPYFIKTNTYGGIEVLRRSGVTTPPHPDFIPITDPDQVQLLLTGRHNLLYRDGQLVPKPIVRLDWNQQEHVAGQDVAVVTVHGIPDGYETVRIRVGNHEADLPVGDPIEITQTVPGHVVVQVIEPTLACEPIAIRFLPES